MSSAGPRTRPAPAHIAAIDAGRGLAASYVVLAHVFQILGYKYSLSNWPLLVDMASAYAHQAVLFFFLLSGFSIHYASLDRPLDTWAGVRLYYYLRLRRVVPIFFVVVAGLLAVLWLGKWLALPGYDEKWQAWGWRDVIYSLLFLTDRAGTCGRIATVLPSDPPFWSLSYEMFYYLIYPLFWLLARHFTIGGAVLAGAIASVAAIFFDGWQCHHVFNVLQLYYVWCLGAWVADVRRHGMRLAWPRWLMYAQVFLAAAAAWTVAESAWLRWEEPLWVAALFPLLALSVAGWGEISRRQAMLASLAMVLGLAAVLGIASVKAVSHDMAMFCWRVLLLAAIVLLWVWSDGLAWRQRARGGLIRLFLPLGAVSYALYLVHYPALAWARAVTEKLHWPVSAALLCLPPVLALAWGLELRLQPRAVAWLERLRKGRRGDLVSAPR